MRTFHWDAPIIIGAGALLFSLLPPASLPLKAEDNVKTVPGGDAGWRDIDDLKAKLDASDRRTAVRALQLALTEIGDGEALVWRRPGRALTGRIKPLSAFRDGHGRICRRVVYRLALGNYAREIEGIGCRESDGSWSLSG